MVKIVFYLPHYDTKIRKEFEFKAKPSQKQLDEARQSFFNDFAYPVIDKSGRFQGGTGDRRYKKQYEWREETKSSVKWSYTVGAYIKEGKSVKPHFRSYSKWTSSQERFIRQNPDASIKDLMQKFNKSYDSVRIKRQRILMIRKIK